MAIRSGLAAQVGIGQESTHGTFVTPNRFMQFNDEGLAAEILKIRSSGLGRGMYDYADDVITYQKGAGGPVNFDVRYKGFLLLLKHIFGSIVSEQVAETDEYGHAFDFDADGLWGDSLTVQVGKPDTGGTVRPFTYLGSKILSAEFSIDTGGVLKLAVEFRSREEVTSQTLATASYPTNATLVSFHHGVLQIDETPVKVKSLNWKITRAMDVERDGIGSPLADEPIANDKLVVEGGMDAEFKSLDAYTAFKAGEQMPLSLVFTGPTIPDEATPFKLGLDIPLIEYTGETPKVGGPGIVRQPLPWKALANGTDSLISMFVNSDETAA